jgi:hypothetical protein
MSEDSDRHHRLPGHPEGCADLPRVFQGRLGVPTAHFVRWAADCLFGGTLLRGPGGIAPMDSSGFEPEAPALQTRCSTS